MEIEYVDKIKYDKESREIIYLERSFDDPECWEEHDITVDDIHHFIKCSDLWNEFLYSNSPIYWLNGLIDENYEIISMIEDTYKNEIIKSKRCTGLDEYVSEIKLPNEGLMVIYYDNHILSFMNLFINDNAKKYLEKNIE